MNLWICGIRRDAYAASRWRFVLGERHGKSSGDLKKGLHWLNKMKRYPAVSPLGDLLSSALVFAQFLHFIDNKEKFCISSLKGNKVPK